MQAHVTTGSEALTGEGDGAGAEGDDGADVNAGVAEGDGDEGLQLVETELGSLAQAEEP